MVDSLVLAARNQKSQPPAYYKNHFVVIYSGNIGPIYDFDALVKTAGHLQTEPSVLMVIRGSGEMAPALKSELGRLGYSNVLFLGSSSRAEALNHIAWADVCVLPLKDGLDKAASYPVKLIEYLAMGKPVIALADGPIRSWLVDTQAGLALSPGDSKGLAREIIRLKADPHLVASLSSRASSASLEFLPARFRLGAIDVIDNLVRERACAA